jgi:hypothetical protein
MVEEIMIMIILRLFSDIVAPLDIIQHQMKWSKIWQGAVMACLNVLSWYLSAETEEGHEKSLSGLPVSQSKFEAGSSWLKV